MKSKETKMVQSLDTVRERERESYTLVNKRKSAVLFGILRNMKNGNKLEHRLFIYVHFLCT